MSTSQGLERVQHPAELFHLPEPALQEGPVHLLLMTMQGLQGLVQLITQGLALIAVAEGLIQAHLLPIQGLRVPPDDTTVLHMTPGHHHRLAADLIVQTIAIAGRPQTAAIEAIVMDRLLVEAAEAVILPGHHPDLQDPATPHPDPVVEAVAGEAVVLLQAQEEAADNKKIL